VSRLVVLVVLILAALIVLHLAVGATAGLLAWDAGRIVQSRLPASTQLSTDR
jgi:hypothetical protein